MLGSQLKKKSPPPPRLDSLITDETVSRLHLFTPTNPPPHPPPPTHLHTYRRDWALGRLHTAMHADLDDLQTRYGGIDAVLLWQGVSADKPPCHATSLSTSKMSQKTVMGWCIWPHPRLVCGPSEPDPRLPCAAAAFRHGFELDARLGVLLSACPGAVLRALLLRDCSTQTSGSMTATSSTCSGRCPVGSTASRRWWRRSTLAG